MKNLIIGIDPGFTGALAVLGETGATPYLITVIDMPLLGRSVFGGNDRANIDLAKLVDWIKIHQPLTRAAYVERVSASPGAGVSSMFRFGEGLGLIRGVLAALGIKTYLPMPGVWKPSMGLNRDKETSLAMARKVPGAKQYLTRIKDHGRAEAILLAIYGIKALASVPRGGGVDDLF